MRVIGGEFRSRLLKSLPGMDVRPTPDRLREALFNVLAPRIQGATFADVYAGTGAVGIEALSRGARRAIFVEQSRDAIGVIRTNLKSLGVEGRAQILQARAKMTLPALRADIVFVDPPYCLSQEYASALEIMGAKPPSLVIVQHDARLELPEVAGALQRTRELRQGDNVLSFYEAQS
jgi:16S rRNA (guanine(966)-N(2))-methyltransferase RsmD